MPERNWRELGVHLSQYEAQVLEGYTAGETYKQMAERRETSVKSVDNALQRAKRKLEEKLGTLQ